MTINKKTPYPPEHYRAVAAMELGREDFLRGIRECPRYYCSKDLLYDSWHLGQKIEAGRQKIIAAHGTA